MQNDHQILPITPASPKSRQRKRSELILGIAVFLVVVFLTSFTLSFGGVDSVLFVALLNLNIILLLLVLFLVVRNGVKLLLERRRGVLGSRLRTKLVITFILLSLLPTGMMFIASTRAVQTAVDYWFRNRVESYIQIALSVGTQYIDSTSTFLQQQANSLVLQAAKSKALPNSPAMEELLKARQSSFSFALVGLLAADGKTILWLPSEQVAPAWQEASERLSWGDLGQGMTFKSIFQPGQDADYAFGVKAILNDETSEPAAYLVLGLRLEQGTLYRLDSLARGSSEYRDLKELRKPFKTTFYFFLGLIAMIVTLGAMWFGFRLSKELTTPLLALMEGTERIAKGDLSIRFDDSGTDEVGLLVQSFNRMTEDLEQSDRRIRTINKDLSLSNEKLAERTNYIETVLNSVAAGVISLDKDERISTINKAACNIFNLPREVFLGKHPTELLRGKQVEFISELLEQVRKNPGVKQQRQMSVVRGQREWKLLITGTALVDQDGEFKGIVAVFEDITELEKAQRMAAWREVARRIAHEIKNPLTPIKLSAQRLERKFGQNVSDPSFSECTHLIVRQVEQLQQMVEEFSAFAKLPEVNLQHGELLPLLEELVGLFKNSHSNIRWELSAPAENLPLLYIDYAALYRAFLNILTNAAEALQAAPNPAVRLSVRYNRAQNVVQVDVEDNGPGLPVDDPSHLFEPYFSRKKGGTGLGLTIVKSIVNDHLGYVRARNNQAGGAIITVELPVRD